MHHFVPYNKKSLSINLQRHKCHKGCYASCISHTIHESPLSTWQRKTIQRAKYNDRSDCVDAAAVRKRNQPRLQAAGVKDQLYNLSLMDFGECCMTFGCVAFYLKKNNMRHHNGIQAATKIIIFCYKQCCIFFPEIRSHGGPQGVEGRSLASLMLNTSAATNTSMNPAPQPQSSACVWTVRWADTRPLRSVPSSLNPTHFLDPYPSSIFHCLFKLQ